MSTLPHGLRVVTEQTPGARAFNVGFFVAVGSRDESRELHGASHFLEHVLFKGTPTRDAEQISASIEAQGGDLNAYTTREYTCFHMRVLTEQAELAVDVLSDMLANSLIRPADFGIELVKDTATKETFTEAEAAVAEPLADWERELLEQSAPEQSSAETEKVAAEGKNAFRPALEEETF